MIRADEIRKRNGQIPFSDGARNGTTRVVKKLVAARVLLNKADSSF